MLLEDSTVFLQYELFDDKLVSIIGELHNKNVTCPQPNISIADWCLDQLAQSLNSKIFLEYNQKYGDPTRIGSKPINDIYANLKKQGKTDLILPFDIRSEFLTKRGQDMLYNGYEFDFLNKQEIYSKFAKPFYDKGLRLIHDSETSYGKIVDEYHKDIIREFDVVNEALNMEDDDIREKFKYAWMLVSDYPILATISNPNRSETEFIIVAGNNHVKNIEEFLDNAPFAKLLIKSSGGKSKCTPL